MSPISRTHDDNNGIIGEKSKIGGRTMALVSAKCTQCGAMLKVDDSLEAAVCEYCGAAYIVEKAINNYNTTIINNNHYDGATINVASENVPALLKRTELFLEDGDWKNVDLYCERVLDQEPENASAYLYKLFASFRYRKFDDFKHSDQCIDKDPNYQKCIRFADSELKEKLELAAAGARKNATYLKACKLLRTGRYDDIVDARLAFLSIGDYKDTRDKVRFCENRLKSEQERILREERIDKFVRRGKTILICCGVILGVGVFIAAALSNEIKRQRSAELQREELERENELLYRDGLNKMNSGSYADAIEVFEVIRSYGDCESKIRECEGLLAEEEERKAGFPDNIDLSGTWHCAITDVSGEKVFSENTIVIDGKEVVATIPSENAEIKGVINGGEYPDEISIDWETGFLKDKCKLGEKDGKQTLSVGRAQNSGGNWQQAKESWLRYFTDTYVKE